MVLMEDEEARAKRITVWQCIGCGKIEGPKPCIGVCNDRKVEFVYASVYDEAVSQAAFYRWKSEALEALIRRLAYTTPHEGEWERSYRTFQDQALRTLLKISANTSKQRSEK